MGLVASLNRPGGNVTGVTILDVQLGPKRLELLHELVPGATDIAALVNSGDPKRSEIISNDLLSAARPLGVKLHVLHASSAGEFDSVFGEMVRLRAGGLVIGGDPFFNNRREELGALALHHAIPAIYQFREFAASGGLASYGTDLVEANHLVGLYAGRVLKGEKPADLPVQQATNVELIINLKNANVLGIAIPLPRLGRADEVIE
jgi:putative ABC transport system substrate-binding protein